MYDLFLQVKGSLGYQFFWVSLTAVLIGASLGFERERAGKVAGLTTHSFVMLGSAIFAFLSDTTDVFSHSRIAANIVTGVGFIGGGLILRDMSGKIENLTTAAEIWVCSAIGMALGFRQYSIAIISTFFAFVIFRLLRPLKNRIREAQRWPKDPT